MKIMIGKPKDYQSYIDYFKNNEQPSLDDVHYLTNSFEDMIFEIDESIPMDIFKESDKIIHDTYLI